MSKDYDIDYNTTIGEILNITDPDEFKEVIEILYEWWKISKILLYNILYRLIFEIFIFVIISIY